MDLVTDPVQWYEKWCYPLFYLEFAHWEKKRMYPHPRWPSRTPSLGFGLFLGGWGSRVLVLHWYPHMAPNPCSSLHCPCAVAGRHLVSLSHPIQIFPCLIKNGKGDSPGNTGWIWGGDSSWVFPAFRAWVSELVSVPALLCPLIWWSGPIWAHKKLADSPLCWSEGVLWTNWFPGMIPHTFTVCKAVVACPEETCRRNAGPVPTWPGCWAWH